MPIVPQDIQPTDLESALAALGAVKRHIPLNAIRWTLDNWDTAGPVLCAWFDEAVSGDTSDPELQNTLFYVVHLLGAQGETRIFPSFCLWLLDSEIEDILGDALTAHLPGLLINTFDGDIAPLKAIIESNTANEYASNAALEAVAYLTASGRVPRADMHAYLLRLFRELPRDMDMVWVGWVMAAGLLGFADLRGKVAELLEGGSVIENFMDIGHFDKDIENFKTAANPCTPFETAAIKPFTDVEGAFEKWRMGGADGPSNAAQNTFTNPFKSVGRNDPCPCGSGKKFKKCCLV